MGKGKKSGKQVAKPKAELVPASGAAVLRDVRNLIANVREATASAVNSALVVLYWQVGHRIRIETLQEKRAEYGEEIVSTVSRQLAAEFGQGFSRPNLFRMVRFAEVFPKAETVTALSRQLGWSHFVEIIYLKEALKREFCEA